MKILGYDLCDNRTLPDRFYMFIKGNEPCCCCIAYRFMAIGIVAGLILGLFF